MADERSNPPSLTYRDAGVDMEAGERFVERIKPAVARAQRPEVLGQLGGFGALFQLPTGYRQPVLVSGTDGVGTKLKLAQQWQRHEEIGIDLVAMCVNDVLVAGAEPLFFLDYYATGHLEESVAATVVEGIAQGCEAAGCALVGGETAEMPGLYQPGDYDLAGFCVGIVEKDGIIDGRNVQPGDALVGLASSGPHSNGYSLIRRILADTEADAETVVDGRRLADLLLTPTRIYVRPVLNLLRRTEVRALAHITGGGIQGNLSRVLPKGTRAVIDTSAWIRPPVFDWLAERGNVADSELFATFNCGVGMVICVPESELDSALATLREGGERANTIGRIEAAEAGAEPSVELER